MIYKTCPYCGAHLDPGERCDCDGAKKEAALLQQKRPSPNDPVPSLADRAPNVKTGGRGVI